jgi:hypothetical protein
MLVKVRLVVKQQAMLVHRIQLVKGKALLSCQLKRVITLVV